jgi:hypothetical protein
MEKTIRLLLKLDMNYVVPEEEYGTVWTIPKRYSEAQLRSMLTSLPITFHDQGFNLRYDVFIEIDNAHCFTYKLQSHRKSIDA